MTNTTAEVSEVTVPAVIKTNADVVRTAALEALVGLIVMTVGTALFAKVKAVREARKNAVVEVATTK